MRISDWSSDVCSSDLNKECLYIPMGSKDVTFEGDGARFYLASLPAHKICPIKHVTLDQANPLARGDLATSNQRTIYQLVIPGVCDSAQPLHGQTVVEDGDRKDSVSGKRVSGGGEWGGRPTLNKQKYNHQQRN